MQRIFNPEPRAARFKYVCAAGALAACCLSVAAGAATPPYNPGGLGPADLARVSDICENVMGLSPSEPLIEGVWIGAERLGDWSNHYRACILSLSDAVNAMARARAADQARHSCQAKGLKPGSPELAECILEGSRSVSALPTLVSAPVPHLAQAFYRLSPAEEARREEVACASLGLEPATGAFDACVKELGSTLFAIDHPAD